MAQVSHSNLDVEEDDVELSLGLSIGSSRNRRPTIASSSSTVDLRGFDGRDEAEPNSMDPQKKRELHALRRQEARKKRAQKKNGQYFNGNGISVNNHLPPMRSDSVAEKMMLELQRSEARVRDRAVKENEGSRSNRRAADQNVALTLSPNPNPNPNVGGYHHPNGFTVMPPPQATGMQYPFPPMGYVPFSNGFHYPYMMPYWGPTAVPSQPSDSAVNADGGCRAFRPFQASDRDQNGDRVAGSDSGQNGSKGGGRSTGSTGSSSSAVSDNQSESMRGGSSSDTRSHSSLPSFVQSQPQVSPKRNPQHQLEKSASTYQLELAHQGREATEKPETMTPTKAGSTKPEELAQRPIANTTISDLCKPDQHQHHTIVATKPISTAKNPLQPPPTDGHDCDEGKKPEPTFPSLPHMPCVSTTGNGPNGKTVTGFLYRYTKSEVSIVCVCHGSSFSPAEFVKHAGGTDVAHPLKHIVVVPSAFG